MRESLVPAPFLDCPNFSLNWKDAAQRCRHWTVSGQNGPQMFCQCRASPLTCFWEQPQIKQKHWIQRGRKSQKRRTMQGEIAYVTRAVAMCTPVRKTLWVTDSGIIPLSQPLPRLSQTQHHTLQRYCSLFLLWQHTSWWLSTGRVEGSLASILFLFFNHLNPSIYPSIHSISHQSSLSAPVVWCEVYASRLRTHSDGGFTF